jgi:DNA-directed RNA polymerase specialized sigma24 family protein
VLDDGLVAGELSSDSLERALAADPAAVRALIADLLPIVQARVLRGLARHGRGRSRDPRQELEDLTQEVFAALFADRARVLRSWDPARGLSLANFVGLVAERQVGAILRTGRRSPWTEDPTLEGELEELAGSGGLPDAALHSRELFAALLGRLREALSPLGMHLFRELIVDERSVAEVSAATKMSTDALYAWRSRLARLVRKLAVELESESGVSNPRLPWTTPLGDGEPQ